MQDSDVHIQVMEIGSRTVISKIVQKRDPEYLQGTDQYFGVTPSGERFPLTEEQHDLICGISRNPEDVYECDGIELVGLEAITGEHFVPRDTWDIIYDATDYLRAAKRLTQGENAGGINGQTFLQMSSQRRAEVLQKLADHGSCRIYSAKWFPRKADKRIKTVRAKRIEALLKERTIPRSEMARLIGRPYFDDRDKRPGLIRELTGKAEKMTPGPDRARVMRRAQSLKQSVRIDRQRAEPPVMGGEKERLWSLWMDSQMREHGSVKLMPWQFEAAMRAKKSRER
jgi:hypothetical protein